MLAESVPSQRMGYRYHLHGHVKVKYIHNLSETATHVLVLGCMNPAGRQVARRTKFYAVTPNICRSSL